MLLKQMTTYVKAVTSGKLIDPKTKSFETEFTDVSVIIYSISVIIYIISIINWAKPAMTDASSQHQ